jgi:hypothetical protein
MSTEYGHRRCRCALRSDDTDARCGLPLALWRPDRLSCCRILFVAERLSPSARERVQSAHRSHTHTVSVRSWDVSPRCARPTIPSQRSARKTRTLARIEQENSRASGAGRVPIASSCEPVLQYGARAARLEAGAFLPVSRGEADTSRLRQWRNENSSRRRREENDRLSA